MRDRLISLGKLSALYERGFLRYIKAGELEILRMIYFALRDHQWETLPLNLRNETVQTEGESFHISYDAISLSGGVEVFQWSVKLSGNSKGEIIFEVNGEALTEFKRNRAGICVLHPVRETIGRPVEVVHPGGLITNSDFPAWISPHQVFNDIKELRWRVNDKLKAELYFEGDVFETEDQRNWMDASFKTYSTPLALPYPVLIRKGHQVHQKVTLKISGLGNIPDSVEASNIQVWISTDPLGIGSFPKIGTCQSTGQPSLTVDEAALLKRLSFSHLRIDLNFTRQGWSTNLKIGTDEALLLAVPIELALTFSQDAEMEWAAFKDHLGILYRTTLPVVRVTVFTTPGKATSNELLDLLGSAVKQTFPNALIGAGSNIYFTELNRHHFDYDKVDYVSYPLNPQVHATDDRTLVENLEACAYVVSSALKLTAHKPQHTSPVTLRPRYNPDSGPVESLEMNGLPFDVDLRQGTDFAAAWTLGILKYLSESGATTITLYETHGMKGYIKGKTDPHHKLFLSKRNVFPVYDLISRIRDFKPTAVVRSFSSNPLAVSSLVLRRDAKMLVAIANHTKTNQVIAFELNFYELGADEILFIPSTNFK